MAKSHLSAELMGARGDVSPRASESLPGDINYLIGNDPRRWRTNVRRYQRLECPSLYPGVDVVYRSTGRGIEYHFDIAVHANPERVRLRFQGARSIRMSNAGDLIVETHDGELRHRKPTIWQGSGRTRRIVDGTYDVAPDGVGFRLSAYDRSVPITI